MARWRALRAIDGAQPSDLVVLIDGDDWFAHPEALEWIVATNRERRLAASHGNFVDERGSLCEWSADYPEQVKRAGAFRSHPWLATHPRTFRFGLVEHLTEAMVRDDAGHPWRAATDMAIYLPVLELAGIHSGFLAEPTYVYNTRGGTAVSESRIAQQSAADTQLRRRPPLPPLVDEVIESCLWCASRVGMGRTARRFGPREQTR